MWRAMILAMGISLVLLGGQCMVVDKVILADSVTESRGASPAFEGLGQAPRRVFVPPEWSPWALLASGAVIVLYSYTRIQTDD